MYFRIDKALNVLLWMIPCSKKSIGEIVVNTTFHQVCRHVRVVESLFLLDFYKHSSLFI